MMKYCPGACGNLARQKLEAAQQQQSKQKSCRDVLERCAVWANVGECETNREKMHQYCPLACGICEPNDEQEEDDDEEELQNDYGSTSSCQDSHAKCHDWAQRGECEVNTFYMHKHCPRSCQVCGNQQPQTVNHQEPVSDDTTLIAMTTEFGELQRVDGAEAYQTLERIEATLNYMYSDQVAQLPKSVRTGCLNRHELCTFWAVIGECDNNKAYMTTNCAPACQTCHMIDFQARCPPIPSHMQQPALTPGQLDAMFIRIVTTAPGNQTDTSVNPDLPPYTVYIHSSPDDNGRPWVITLDDFVTNEEADALIQHCYEEGYKRSEDVGKPNFDGSYDSVQSEGRTSENAWCSAFQKCRWKEVPNRILERISLVTGIPANNSEDLQLLKYESGQFYRQHHDYIGHQRERNCGPRILTFFLYLSDVEAGGGTNFPSLGLTIQPKRGRALLWPSVLNDAPMNKDRRMEHQALPVERGTKFAANAWLHMYDYVTPQERGCN
jgi:prolyl 4-hydroxylase